MLGRLPLYLASRELRYDWRASMCFIAALVGVLAPLLIILSLKNGIIGSMVGRLVEDPNNREIIAVGAGNFDAAFFQTLAGREDVAFIIPASRSINTSADVLRNKSKRKVERSVPLIPSAKGDPLLGDVVVSKGNVVVTDALAQALELDTDSTIEMFIGRNIDGQDQTAKGEFRVSQILSKDAHSRSAMFLSLEDLIAIERFRDDPNVQVETWFSNASVPETYASFRLYAARLESLEPLKNLLASMSVEARPRAENATLLLGFRNNLNILYLAVAVLAILGFWAAMAANLRGMVERQRIMFSLLDLMALPIKARCMIPIWQSLILVASGIVATFLIVLPMVAAINAFFVTASGPFVAYIGWVDVLGTVVICAITAFTASLWALTAVRDILPEEVLRHA
jgi:putative ABC transport system permease protein